MYVLIGFGVVRRVLHHVSLKELQDDVKQMPNPFKCALLELYFFEGITRMCLACRCLSL